MLVLDELVSLIPRGDDRVPGGSEELTQMVDEHAEGTGGERIVLFPEGC